MAAKAFKTKLNFIGTVVYLTALSLFVGCSQQTASESQQPLIPQMTETREEISKPTSTKTQASSLEALQKGTLGKGAEEGPLRDVHFDFDRYDLRPDVKEILDGHAAWLKANPQVKAEIEGHCDDRGTNEYNLALGAKRAESVKSYLVDLGVGAGRLSTISYGEEIPLCKEDNEACWAKNRRAHFVVKPVGTF